MQISDVSGSTWRLLAFAGVLVVTTLAEALWPRRKRLFTRAQRWPAQLGIAVLGAVAVRAMALVSVPLVAIAAATWAERHSLGLLNRVDGPSLLEFGLSLLLLDLLIWGQHALFHRVPLLWRIHRMHHADRDFDVTTGLRFHPVEIVLSMLLKTAAVLLLGPPVLAVLVFEVLLNALAMFNHANLALPPVVDRLLRALIVTPDMHRVHHSVYAQEHHRNFGFNLSLWDRLFATYVAAPRDGHEAMRIGLPEFADARPTRLGWSLWLPFSPADRDTADDSGARREGRP